MKRTIISLLAFLLSSFCLTHAQGIRVGDRFYDGSVVYTVREIRMGTIVYMTDALGDEELTLEQWGATPDVFRLQPSRNADDPKYGAEFGCRVNYVSHPDNKYLEVIGDNDIVLKVLPLLKPMEDITEGSLWYGGALVYDAHPAEDGSVCMNAMAEGEEHGFVLTPATGGVDLFEVSDSPSGAMNVFENAAYARRIRQEGLDVICFYDRKNRLMNALQATQLWDSQALNVEQWMAMIAGDYVTEGGKRVQIRPDRATYGGKALPLQPVTFNGMVTGVFDFGESGPYLVGKVEAVPTPEGLQLTEVKMEDGEPWFERTVSYFNLKWAGERSRFDFASHTLLCGGLQRYDKQFLRVMRNAILAAHGYVFKSKDLKTYFEAQPWYTPATSNASVTLSLLEQLNIALIQSAERAE
ncbi:MAG: YARHG domain-containing protein [Bacteroidales bacterium]|nr:YARHG domain-containing protein [Bacteroidales bacterium]MBR3450915.1 YARHG domain-containing protein [Bacteroidales bacterium]